MGILSGLFRSKGDNKKKILIVEDEENLQVMLAEMLTQHGYTVISAYNGQDGIDKAKSELPDLIVMDLNMPEMDGMTACRMIKQNFGTQHIPVIILTAMKMPEQMEKSFQSGANAYITKPFESQHLYAKIQKLIAASDASSQR